MKYLNSPFIKLTLTLLLGVLAGFYIPISLLHILALTALLCIIFILRYTYTRKSLFEDPVFGILAYSLFFLTGMLTTQLQLPENQPRHYIHTIPLEERSVLQIRITEGLKPDLYNDKFIAEVEAVNNRSSHGSILLLFSRDSTETSPATGERLLVATPINEIPSSRNPHQFDYRRFMGNRGVMRQINPGKEEIAKIGKVAGPASLAEEIRTQIVTDLRKNNFDREELAIIQALLLGQRQDISPETYRNFSAAGAIHILAVSGLHVGIILLLLHRIFSPLERSPGGKILKMVLVIVLLWGFAVLAGLSPSVVRAVTMFSFIAVGMQIKRRTSVMNSVFLSLMLLVLLRPQFLFEVGFQLSYLAVISIILFQPLIYNILEPKNKILKYFWGILSVTIAAQAGVLPLSLFYFHQFPGLFFLSNLVILPFLGFILAMGILVILLSLADYLPSIVADIYNQIIEGLNSFVAWIARREDFLLENTSLSLLQVLGCYLVLIAAYKTWSAYKAKNLIYLLSAIATLQFLFIFEATQARKNEFIIFHKPRHTILGYKKESVLRISHTLSTAPLATSPVKDFFAGENLREFETRPREYLYKIDEQILLVIDSTGIYHQQLTPNFVLLTGSPKVNLDRLINDLQPALLIADGNNYKSYVKRWKKSGNLKGIPFHDTSEKGARIIK